MKPNISIVDKAKVRIPAFECRGKGKISQKTIDLTPYAGQHVRIWIDDDGGYSMDPKKGHYWQVAEFDVPEIEHHMVDTGKVEKAGDPIMETKALPLDLTKVKIKKWDLPES